MHKINPIPFTKEGYQQLKVEQQHLTEKRKETVEHLRKAREMGDLSENGYYKAAKFELGQIDRRLRKLVELIRYGTIVQSSQSDIVEIGSKVTVSEGETTRTFSIVGGHESNPLEHKISHVSPIGKALMGKKVGENVTIETPSGKVFYAIVSVSIG